MKRFFLSRKTIFALIILALGSIVVAYIFPQRFSSSSETLRLWQEAHPFWVPWVERLGLDHVYFTPWFAVLLFTFSLTLAVSTYEQVKLSIKKTFGKEMTSGGKSLEVTGSEEDLVAAIKQEGYLQTTKAPEFLRLVKHPWGYWGNVLLHLGILLTIVSSLLIVLTQKRGLLQLIEGEVYIPGSRWTVEDNGILAGAFILPEAVRLNRVTAEFWETDNLKQLTTSISFISPQGRFTPYMLAINQILHYRGLRVYQGQSFGTVFFVELEDREGRRDTIMLHIGNPAGRDKPGYGDFRFEGIPYLLKAKYFVDAEKQSMNSMNPLLVMRLMDREQIAGEVSLKQGESGALGPYNAKLVGVSRWAGLIFVDLTGMPGIFFGFFIIILGGGLTYFFPPREFLVRKEEEGFSLSWRAARFEGFYQEEFKKISDVLIEKEKVKHE